MPYIAILPLTVTDRVRVIGSNEIVSYKYDKTLTPEQLGRATNKITYNVLVQP